MPKNIIIREAENPDKSAILKLIRSCLPHDSKFAIRYYNSYFSDDPITNEDLVLVAEVGGNVIGVIGYNEDYFSNEYSYHLTWLVVDKGYQRWNNGEVAGRLLEGIEDDLRRHGVRKLFASAADKPDRCHGFYLKNGFHFEGRLKDYYGKGEDQIVFGKELQAIPDHKPD